MHLLFSFSSSFGEMTKIRGWFLVKNKNEMVLFGITMQESSIVKILKAFFPWDPSLEQSETNSQKNSKIIKIN